VAWVPQDARRRCSCSLAAPGPPLVPRQLGARSRRSSARRARPARLPRPRRGDRPLGGSSKIDRNRAANGPGATRARAGGGRSDEGRTGLHSNRPSHSQRSARGMRWPRASKRNSLLSLDSSGAIGSGRATEGFLRALDAAGAVPRRRATRGHDFHRLEGEGGGTSTTVPMARLKGDCGWAARASFRPAAWPFPSSPRALYQWVGRRCGPSSARTGFAAASAGSTEALCSSASAMKRRELLWKIGRPRRRKAHAPGRGGRAAMGGAGLLQQKLPVVPVVLWELARVEREQGRDCAGVQLLRRLQQLLDPRHSDRRCPRVRGAGERAAASVTWADSPPSWRAEGSPDSTSLRAIAPRRGSVTRSQRR